MLKLCAIYNHYIEHTTITFDEQSLQPEAFALQIEHVSQRYPWLVIEEKGQVLGYAYASEWGSRSAFRYTVASSIYLHPEAPKRKGMGKCSTVPCFHNWRTEGFAGLSLPLPFQMKAVSHCTKSWGSHRPAIFTRWVTSSSAGST